MWYNVTFWCICVKLLLWKRYNMFPLFVAELHVNCKKKLSTVATQTYKAVPFALLSSYTLFRTAVDNMNGTYVFI